ncbi:MAG TPA: FHA domain-containing protein [Vicinamibacterales bacterium]|nr:FHA domain-containing protein [Vicinamibacterales bacterium]
MKQAIRRLLSGTRALESRLAGSIEGRAQTFTGAPVTQPLEVIERALADIAGHVQPAGRGRRTFPFNRVGVTFLAPTAEARARIDAICASEPPLERRLLDRLHAAGCDIAEGDLDLSIDFADTAGPDWAGPYALALARVPPAARAPRREPAPPLRIDVLVTAGAAGSDSYSFTALPIAIGRGVEVRDRQQRLVRINHVAFSEAAEGEAAIVNHTVSRRHARIELDADSGRPRLVDDNSAQGTSIIRGGRGIGVPRGSRGLGLQTGDEIVLGQARLTVKIST